MPLPSRPRSRRWTLRRFVAAAAILAVGNAVVASSSFRLRLLAVVVGEEGSSGASLAATHGGSGGGGGGKRFIRADDPGDDRNWVESHSPPRHRSGSGPDYDYDYDYDGSSRLSTSTSDERDVRISFRLHDPDDVMYPRKFLSVPGYMCHVELFPPFPPSISDDRILNFTTTISTDLNILFVGDSISQQFAQGFYSAVLDDEHVRSHEITRSFINGQEPLVSGLHVCSSLVAPGRGGGTSAYWRVLELMSNETEVRAYVNCKRETGWLAQEGKKLARHRYLYPPTVGVGEEKRELVKVETNKNNGATTWYRSRADDILDVVGNETRVRDHHQVGAFDACVIRPQHGWMELGEITRDRIVDEIVLCGRRTVGATTVVVSTLPLNNNVLTAEDWDGIIGVNEAIRDIARNWKEEGGVRWVLVQEFGNFTNQLLWHNAQHIGYNVTMPDFASDDGWERRGSEFLLHRYRGIKSMRHAPSIPMVCAYHIDEPFSTRNETAGQCFFNRISKDGMHWCVESLGSRYSASVACLLGCVYNGGGPAARGDDVGGGELGECERECNDRFMSVVPVDDGWIGTNATIFSRRQN